MIDNFIKAKEEHPCAVCRKPTNRVEINYECFCCSDECERWLDEEYGKACESLVRQGEIVDNSEEI